MLVKVGASISSILCDLSLYWSPLELTYLGDGHCVTEVAIAPFTIVIERKKQRRPRPVRKSSA